MFSPWPVYDRVFVNLTDGSAISGLLTAQKGQLLVLNDATLYSPDSEPAALDGQIYIEREKVLYLQATP
jgi:small nuclear ribonucleoprotein (snRNP)-like protein